jgi:hypothetical protein
MFDETKLDETMRPHWERLRNRLNLDTENSVGKLYTERAVYDFTEAAGFRFSEEERAKMVASICADSASTVEELLNCIVRQVGRVKVAYPNYPNRRPITGSDNKEGIFLSLGLRAADYVSSGLKESDALRRVLNNVPLETQLDFLSWYGLTKGGEWKHLAVASFEDKMIKVAYDADGSFVYEFMRRKDPAEQDAQTHSVQAVPDVRSAEEFRVMRDKMIGRTFAIDKLLEKHRHLLNEEQVGSIEDVLNSLRKNIRRLKVATLTDVIEKTAFIAEQNNWFEGAMICRALAESDDKFAKTAAAASSDLLLQVIDSLTETAAHLRQRALIRDLAARDIDLFNLGYGHMGEVGDATAKLMEAFNGAANKIEDVASRLRGELQQKTGPKVMPEKVRTIVSPADLPLVRALEPPTVRPAESTTVRPAPTPGRQER